MPCHGGCRSLRSGKYIDLRWARMATDLPQPEFLRQQSPAARPLQGQPLDELIGEDVRQHRRTRRVRRPRSWAGDPRGRRQRLRRDRQSTARCSTAAEQIAVRQTKIATEQRDQARRRLVQLNVANGLRAADAGDVSAALLWFVEATKLEADHAVEQACCAPAWRRSLVGIPAWRKCGLPLRPSVASAYDGAWVVVYSPEGSVQAWDAQTASAAASSRRVARGRYRGHPAETDAR